MFINNDFKEYNIHYSGWKSTIEYLSQIDADILIDVYTDATFGWRQDKYVKEGIVPFKREWIGMIHHTILGNNNSCDIFSNELFIESLVYCKCLIVLSKDLKMELTKLTSKLSNHVPIFVIMHPTDTPDLKFTMDKYNANNSKKLLHVGNWMRDIDEFLKVDSKEVKKEILKGYTNSYAEQSSTIDYLSNNNYNNILSENTVCIFLKGASAINTVIECIVRDTPIFINPLPAVKEYLGIDYPLYVNSSSEVDVSNIEKIRDAHNYLKGLSKTQFEYSDFNDSFCRILEHLNIKYKKVEINKNIGKLGRRRGGVTGNDRSNGVSDRHTTRKKYGHDFF